LSNVKTRWRTVAVAMCIESSSPAFLSAIILSNHKLLAHVKDPIFPSPPQFGTAETPWSPIPCT
jgi:hypothetical protein